MMRGPVWGGPQAAGKRHSQPFCQKRLPHPRGVCQPTKPVAHEVCISLNRKGQERADEVYTIKGGQKNENVPPPSGLEPEATGKPSF